MKATRAVVQQRIDAVADLRLAGCGFRRIRQYAAEKDADTGRPWKVSDRQLWRYIALADEMLADQMEPDRDKRFHLAIAQRQALYVKASEAGDVRAALAVLKDRDELLGLYPGSLADLSRQIEELKRQVEERHGQRKNHPGSGPAESDGRNGQSREPAANPC